MQIQCSIQREYLKLDMKFESKEYMGNLSLHYCFEK